MKFKIARKKFLASSSRLGRASKLSLLSLRSVGSKLRRLRRLGNLGKALHKFPNLLNLPTLLNLSNSELPLTSGLEPGVAQVRFVVAQGLSIGVGEG